MMNKRAQEEMIGFVLIVIIIAVILLVFLSISLKKSSKYPDSPEIDSFLQVLSYYTSDCVADYEPNYLEIRSLIKECSMNSLCLDGRSACDALNTTLSEIVEASWPVGPDYPNKGYSLNITYSNGYFNLEKGNKTINSKSAIENFNDFDIVFEVYF